MKKPNWYIKEYKIADIKELAKNPRNLTQKAKNDIKKSLDRFGLIDKPIINTDGQLIGGHQRLHVLHDEGVEKVECWTPDRKLTEKEVEELNIRLNKNTATWDFDILANDWDIDLLKEWGFDEKDLGINNSVDIESDEEKESEKPKCPHCGQTMKECLNA